jgi:hypothetical protein
MRISFFILLFSLLGSGTYAQNIKTAVVVVGGSPAGVAAAIQSARSGVKTTLLEQGAVAGAELTMEQLMVLKNNPKDYRYFSKKDSTDKKLGGPVTLKNITDTVKNLTVLTNATVQGTEKKGKGWDLRLNSSRTVKTDVVVDATVNNAIALQAGVKKGTSGFATVISAEQAMKADSGKLYRTTAATGVLNAYAGPMHYSIPMGALVLNGIENFFVTHNFSTTIVPDALSLGRAVGGSAAYCAFFSTTSRRLDVRLIQGELLGYGSTLVNYADIARKDTNYIALQHIGLTGLLKFKKDTKGYPVFDPEGTVSSEEIKVVTKEYYTRSQIWFLDNKPEKMTVGDVLSLIKFCAARGNELDREAQLAWKNTFGFKSEFDLKKLVTRREFAVLADTYLRVAPFSVAVDLNGGLVR